MRARLTSVVVAGALLGSAAMAEEAALLETGEGQFLRCAACHSLSADAPALFVPHLEGIVDRRAGTVAGYV